MAGTPPKLICEMDGEPCFSWRVFGSCSQSWTCIPSMLFKAGLHSWFESNYCVTECICLYIREIHMQMHVCQRINYIEQHRTSIQIIPIRYTVYIQYIVIYCVYDYIYIHIQHICIYMCVSLTFSITIVTRAVWFFVVNGRVSSALHSRFQHNCFELLKDFGSMELRLRSPRPMSE